MYSAPVAYGGALSARVNMAHNLAEVGMEANFNQIPVDILRRLWSLGKATGPMFSEYSTFRIAPAGFGSIEATSTSSALGTQEMLGGRNQRAEAHGVVQETYGWGLTFEVGTMNCSILSVGSQMVPKEK